MSWVWVIMLITSHVKLNVVEFWKVGTTVQQMER
jgi:hypothetical protein